MYVAAEHQSALVRAPKALTNVQHVLPGRRWNNRASSLSNFIPRNVQYTLKYSSSVALNAAESEAMAPIQSEQPEQPGPSSTSVPNAAVWELDFCSRPMLDERGKKIWELIICSPDRSFEYSRYFPNNKINSGELKRVLEEILSQPGASPPESIRFFRAQMQTIITRAISDLDIAPTPSRRCFALMNWLEERIETVYKKHPGYSEKATTLFNLDLGPPEELPDALRGESWSFVQLPLFALKEELKAVENSEAFGCTLDLEKIGLDNVADDTLVPGVAVYSRRAAPLAAWTNGLELASLKADTDRAFLILETGVNQRWRYGAYRRSLETTAEAQAWEEAKSNVGGLHFLAVMIDEEAEDCAGLWLLLDRIAPSI